MAGQANLPATKTVDLAYVIKVLLEAKLCSKTPIKNLTCIANYSTVVDNYNKNASLL